MSLNSGRLYRRYSLILSASYFLSFLLYYISNYILVTDATAYVWLFANRLTYLLFPLIAAVIVYVSAPFIGTGRAALYSISLIAPRVLYFIPYFYLKYIVEGFSSLECLGIGLFLSILEALITFGAVMLIYLIMKLILDRSGKDKICEVISRAELDLTRPTSLSIGIASALAAVYFIIGEISDTVVFIIDWGFDFTLAEIIFMTVSYIFDILIAPIYFFLLAFIKNRITELFVYDPKIIEESSVKGAAVAAEAIPVTPSENEADKGEPKVE